MPALRTSLRVLLATGYLLALATLVVPDPVGFVLNPPVMTVLQVTLGFLIVSWAAGRVRRA